MRAAPRVGLVLFLCRRYLLTGCSEETLSPTPGTSSKKVAVCKNTTQLGKCSKRASKGCLFPGAGAGQQTELTALYQQGSARWGTGEALLWDPQCRERDEGNSSCLGSQQRKNRTSAQYLAHSLKPVVTKIGSVGAGFVSPAQQCSQLIQMCCLSELVLPGFPHRSEHTWEHCWHFGCMSWRIFCLMPEPLHLPQPNPCTAALLPVLCHSLVVPGLWTHSLLPSGICLGSGAVLVLLLRLYFTATSFPSTWKFEVSSGCPYLLLGERKVSFFSGKSLHRIFRSDLWI